MTWYEQIYVFISYFQSSVCMCMHTSPVSFQGGQKPNNKESIRKSHMCTPSTFFTSSLSGRQKFKQLDWKNDFLILQDPSILKIKLINMEHSLWKSQAFIWDLSYVSSFQSQYNGLAVLKIQPNLNKHQVGNSSDARWLLKSRTKLWRSVSPSY